MQQVGRPKKPGKLYRYRVTFTLREGEHDPDLIAFFERLPEDNRAQAIINALQDGNAIESQADLEAEKKQRILNNVLDNL